MVADVLDEDFKTIKMLKNLKEDAEKVKNVMCEQNSDINKELESLRNQRKSTGTRMKTSLGFKGRLRRWKKELVNLKTGQWNIWRLRTRKRKDGRKANRA